jgi:hypothetical protein
MNLFPKASNLTCPSALSSGAAARVEQYLAAKDGNRAWIMKQVFAPDAVLNMTVKSSEVSFPNEVRGTENLVEVLCTAFNRQHENVFTFCLTDAPVQGATELGCDWLVAMTRKSDQALLLGCGRYDWAFEHNVHSRVTHLGIAIELMQVLPKTSEEPFMRWLYGCAYPWTDAQNLLAGMPDWPETAPLRAYLLRNA